MRTAVKKICVKGLELSGAYRTLHAGSVVFLTFHRVRPEEKLQEIGPRIMQSLDVTVEDFRNLLQWMKSEYQPMRLSDFLALRGPPPKRAFVVTFDDGWEDNYEYAWPVLKELGIPATIFLSTGALESRTPFWWQILGEALLRYPSPAEAESILGAEAAANRLMQDALSRLMSKKDDESRVQAVDNLLELLKDKPAARLEELARNAWMSLSEGTLPDEMLHWGQVQEMAAGDLITFGPHGHRHLLLTAMPPAEMDEDIRLSWDTIRAKIPTDKIVPVFSYPNGNMHRGVNEILSVRGLKAAVTTHGGCIRCLDGENAWAIPRNNVDYHVSRSLTLFKWMLWRSARVAGDND